MFIPRPDMEFAEGDYSSIEPRLLAHLSGDNAMLELFNSGKDFHSYFAEWVNVDRDTAKVFDLETYYRATKYGVARTLKCDLAKAQQYIDRAWELFPSLRRWEDQKIWESKRSGYVETLLGRRIKIENLNSPNVWEREKAERQLMNNLIQGSAVEIIKKAMITIQNTSFSPSFGLLVQVYDSILAESYDMDSDILILKQCMENCYKLQVPLVSEFKRGFSWGELNVQ
jgi:DNA polymerase-1